MNLNIFVKLLIHICMKMWGYDSYEWVYTDLLKQFSHMLSEEKMILKFNMYIRWSWAQPYFSIALHLNCSRSTNTLSSTHWGEARVLLYVVGAEAKCLTNNTLRLVKKKWQQISRCFPAAKQLYLSGMDGFGDNHLEMIDAGTCFFLIEEVITKRNQ